MDLHWPRDCTAQSSILSTGSVSLILLSGIFLNDLGQEQLSLVSQWSSLSWVGRALLLSFVLRFSSISLHCSPIHFSFVFFMHLLMLLFTSLYFSDPSCSNRFFLSCLLLSHRSRLTAITQGFSSDDVCLGSHWLFQSLLCWRWWSLNPGLYLHCLWWFEVHTSRPS